MNISGGASRRNRWGTQLRWGGVLLIMLGLTLPGFAALGGTVDSVAEDQAHMRATMSITHSAQFSVHELKTGSRLVIREYVSEDGRVFGVAWQGPFLPDMQQILGTYFQQYSVAAQEARKAQDVQTRSFGRRPLSIREPGLVVDSSGHLRAHAGRAYDPSLLPDGVSADVIR